MRDFQPCPLCGHNDFEFETNVREEETLKVYKCMQCGLVQINPPPTVDEDNSYYRNTVVYRHLIDRDKLSDEKLMAKMEAWTTPQVETLKALVTKGEHILEIGSGYGWLVQKMRESGYEMDGIEINNEQRELARLRAGIDLYGYNILMDDFPSIAMDERYDVVCMFHVLEHMPSPVAFLRAAMKALKPGGRIVIEVPNNDDYIKTVSEAYCKFSYKRQHLCYFTQPTLQKSMELADMRDIVVRGMQRYSVENALYWARYNAPFMESYQLAVPEALEFVDSFYKGYLQDNMISEHLLATGKKP